MAFTGSLALVVLLWMWALRLERRGAHPRVVVVRRGLVGLWLSAALVAVLSLWASHDALTGPDPDPEVLGRALWWLRVSVTLSFVPSVPAAGWLLWVHVQARRGG